MINDIKNGNAAAFEEAYNQFSKKVYSYFSRKTNSGEDAQDLLQTVFLKLWQYRKSLSPDYLLEQHLFNIAKTVFIDYLRKENKIQKISKSVKTNSEINNHYLNPSDEFDVAANMQKALSNMPTLRKRIFEMSRIEGYSYKEIAQILSIPVKSVDNNLAKALKSLRNTQLIFLISFALLYCATL